MVEFYANNSADPGDYLIGEKIDIYGTGSPLRYMYNPGLDGASHGCWSTATNGVDVHYSSGVGNHFYFNLAEGTGVTPYGMSPTCGSAPAVVGIGRAKAEAIWWRALDTYFTPTTRYVNTASPANTSRAYTLSAATDLYGLCSVEYRAVQAAWTAVNVAGADAACSNDFSIAVSLTFGTVSAGTSVTATVSTAVTAGVAEVVSFSTSGLPAGASAVFSPPSTPTGGSSTMTISTTTSTPPGAYLVTVNGASPSNTHGALYTLTVTPAIPPTGCNVFNDTDVLFAGTGQAISPTTVTGCPGHALATSIITVSVVHPTVSNITVTLIAPDGSTYLLYNGPIDATLPGLSRKFRVDLSSEIANGTWTLQVTDDATDDTGYIDSWRLNIGLIPV
jgi:hypothetical protein